MVFLEEVRREGSHLEVRPINLLSKACRKSSWSCSVAHDEKAALDEAEVPGITEEEEEEPDAVAGPHSDVDGIANGENNFAQRWTMGEGPESRRTTTTTTSSSTRPLFYCLSFMAIAPFLFLSSLREAEHRKNKKARSKN